MRREGRNPRNSLIPTPNPRQRGGSFTVKCAAAALARQVD